MPDITPRKLKVARDERAWANVRTQKMGWLRIGDVIEIFSVYGKWTEFRPIEGCKDLIPLDGDYNQYWIDPDSEAAFEKLSKQPSPAPDKSETETTPALIASRGKSAMVWQLRSWQDGDPDRQLEQCQELGLTSVSLKINDGRQERYERNLWFPSNQNQDLLPATVEVLTEGGIRVTGWGWTYGGVTRLKKIFKRSTTIAADEGQLAGKLCTIYGMDDYYIDAEHQYHRSGMGPVATAFCEALRAAAPKVNQLLCSYRFPLTAQPKFPVQAFAPHVDGWAPQVYWEQDNRDDAGAIQMQRSKENHYDAIRELPFLPVAPTYSAPGPWTATGLQLTNFMQRAVEIGCKGVSFWDLPQANESQLEAIAKFDWPRRSVAKDPTGRRHI